MSKKSLHLSYLSLCIAVSLFESVRFIKVVCLLRLFLKILSRKNFAICLSFLCYLLSCVRLIVCLSVFLVLVRFIIVGSLSRLVGLSDFVSCCL